ncbi:MAG: family 16 glycoside hydrolase [Candidatus Poribacteria bacterium]
MRVTIFCLCAFMAFGFASGIYAVTDDFNDGNDTGWTQIQGAWSVVNGEYAQTDIKWASTATNETYHRSYFGDATWANYTFEAKVRIEKAGETASIPGIFFRVTEKSAKGDYYMFRLDNRAAEGPALIKSPNTILLENKNKPAKVGQNYVLKVDLTGDSIKCYIDGQLEIDLKDASFPKGAVGVGSFNVDCRFDNVTVTNKDVSSAVSSGGKLSITWASIKN